MALLAKATIAADPPPSQSAPREARHTCPTEARQVRTIVRPSASARLMGRRRWPTAFQIFHTPRWPHHWPIRFRPGLLLRYHNLQGRAVADHLQDYRAVSSTLAACPIRMASTRP